MSVTKVSARKWIPQVSTDGGSTWIPVLGITMFSFDRSSTRTDTTDFTADGIETGEVMARSATCKFEGFFMEDLATKARDAGQAAVETFAEAVGAPSVGNYRLTSPGGKLYSFAATVDMDPITGGNNDKAKWGATMTRTGPLTVA